MIRALARVDVGAIRRNTERMAAAAPGAQVCAVVKADAYGHGMVQAARAALAGGAGWLAVAEAVEAAGLREAGIPGRILVLGALSDEELPIALDADADVVAWHEETVARVAAHGGGRVHVKLDTGMGRLGRATRRWRPRSPRPPRAPRASSRRPHDAFRDGGRAR